MRAPRDKDTGFFGHPTGLSTLFFTEMWERLSFYGARAFLAIYMATPVALGGRGMSDSEWSVVIALYLSSGYLLSLLGGWIADRFLGQRKAVTVGGLGIVVGNALLAFPSESLFYPGLVVVAVGTAFLKPNISTIVGQLYKRDDNRRDSGFTIYYMGINIGALIAPLIGMVFAQSESFRSFLSSHGLDPNLCWKVAFAMPSLGMAIGLIQYALGYRKLGDAGLRPTVPADPARAARDRRILVGVIGGMVGLVVLGLAIHRYVVAITSGMLANAFGLALAVTAVAVFVGFYRTARDAGERKRVTAMIPLFIGCIAFFALFEQAASTLSLFAERLVRREYLGMHIVASAYQFINSACVVLLASGFAWMWLRLTKAGKEPSTVTKFAIGMVLNAVSYLVLVPSLSTVSVADGVNPGYLFSLPYRTVSPNYLLVFYFVSTCAELCVSPVGLSGFSRLAPQRIAGMVMGTWFLATAMGEYLAGRAGEVSGTHGYGFLFTVVIIGSLVVAAALFAVAPAIKRMLARDSAAAPLPRAVAEPPRDTAEGGRP
ncbi:MAG TPA: peptide MFS transporter [Kofleriaceae bacterium]|jgi:POT family proton-dependent oligopeptide transporter|nr:peptide MFS transporter [Kofleriaceae bacterium]